MLLLALGRPGWDKQGDADVAQASKPSFVRWLESPGLTALPPDSVS